MPNGRTRIEPPANSTGAHHARGGIIGLLRAAVLSVSHRDFARPVRRFLLAYDRLLYRVTRGRLTVTSFSRIPSLMLIVTRPRGDTLAVPLQYVSIDGHPYIVGTNWCRPSHPLWSSWLLKNPDCRINIKGKEDPRRASMIEAGDRAAVWPKLVQRSAYYGECERRTGRQPRVFRLDPVTSDRP